MGNKKINSTFLEMRLWNDNPKNEPYLRREMDDKL